MTMNPPQRPLSDERRIVLWLRRLRRKRAACEAQRAADKAERHDVVTELLDAAELLRYSALHDLLQRRLLHFLTVPEVYANDASKAQSMEIAGSESTVDPERGCPVS